MVHLSIAALKGNQGGRTYPYAGYLGLSKLTVEGIVRTRVEDDNRLLPSSSLTISVRCYEARTRLAYSKVNLLLDATQTLWAAADGLEYEDLGSGDFPFRILLPSKVAGFSTMQHPDYRVFWRVEAAINHQPYFGLGTRQVRGYDLTLTRYDLPDPLPPPSLTHAGTFNPSGALAFLPPCQYRITIPSTPIGPSSSVPIALALDLPAQSSSSSSCPPVALYSVSVTLERRMDLFEASGAHRSPELLSGTASTTPEPSPANSRTSFWSTGTATPMPVPTHSPSPSFSSSTLIGFAMGRKRSASASAVTVLPAKSLTTTVANAECTLRAAAGRSAELTIDLPVPPRPAPSQWPLGETTRTDLATIAFYVHVRVGVVVQSSSPHHHHHTRPASSSASSSNAAPMVYEYELPEREVQMMNVTEEERANALARIAERRTRSAACSRRTSAGAADAVAATLVLASDGGAGPGAGVPPLPKGANTVKFGVEDAPKGGLSAAMLNSRLKNVKASREAADGAVGGSMSNAHASGSGSGSSAYSSAPSTASSASPGHTTNPLPPSTSTSTSTSTVRKARSKTPSGTRRPQTVSGLPPPAHDSKEMRDLVRMRRSQSGQATYGPRSQSEAVAPDLAPHWTEREHDDWNGSTGSGSGSTSSGGGRSDSEAKVRSCKAPTATATATSAPDVPLPTSPPVPSKDGASTRTAAPKTFPPSPTRPIPPPPSSFSPPVSPNPSPNSSVHLQLSSTPTYTVPMAVDAWASPSPSPSPPASVSSHAYGHAHILRAGLMNPSARSSPNLLSPIMGMGTGTDTGTGADSNAARGRNKQRRPRGDSNVSSRNWKTGFFSSLLSARA